MTTTEHRPLITICEVCHAQRIGDEETGTWIAASPIPAGVDISHGCCPTCNEARYLAAGFEPPNALAKATQCGCTESTDAMLRWIIKNGRAIEPPRRTK
jgi:hypothetical protein